LCIVLYNYTISVSLFKSIGLCTKRNCKQLKVRTLPFVLDKIYCIKGLPIKMFANNGPFFPCLHCLNPLLPRSGKCRRNIIFKKILTFLQQKVWTSTCEETPPTARSEQLPPVVCEILFLDSP